MRSDKARANLAHPEWRCRALFVWLSAAGQSHRHIWCLQDVIGPLVSIRVLTQLGFLLRFYTKTTLFFVSHIAYLQALRECQLGNLQIIMFSFVQNLFTLGIVSLSYEGSVVSATTRFHFLIHGLQSSEPSHIVHTILRYAGICAGHIETQRLHVENIMGGGTSRQVIVSANSP